MKLSNSQSEFIDILETYCDKVSMPDQRLREAALAVRNDSTVIEDPICGSSLVKLEGKNTPYINLTFARAAKKVLRHLED